MSLLKRYRGDYLLIGLVALLSATAVPLYLISVQPEEFLHFDIAAFLGLSLLLTLGLTLAGVAVFTLLVVLGASLPARFGLRFLLFWVALTGFLLPVVGSAALIDPAKLDENYLNIFIALLGAGVLASLALSPRLKAMAYVFLGILFLSTVVTAAPVLARLYSAPQRKAVAKNEVFSLSKQANLVVISLDGIPGGLVSELLKEHAELRTAFQDFLVFDNAVSLAPATVESMMGELFGNRDFRAIAATQNEVLQHLDLQSIPFNQKATDGTVEFTFGFYSRFNRHLATSLDTGDMSGISQADRLVDMLMFLEYSLARLSSARTVRLLRKLKVTQFAIAPLVSSYEGELALRLFHHKGPLWDLGYIKHVKDYEAYISKLHTGSHRRYVAYMHFSHTHFPVDLDSECNYHGDDAQWIARAQNRAGLAGEALCGLRQTARLLAKLKSLGVYENTLLVLKSDHGQPADFFTQPPDNFRINQHPSWGFNRYRPMLLVKNIGQRLNGPVFLPDLVALGDLARTICVHWEKGKQQCSDLVGIDLFGSRDPSVSPYLYLNVVKDEKSDFTFDTHKTVRLERSRSQQDILKQLQGVQGVSFSESKQRPAY